MKRNKWQAFRHTTGMVSLILALVLALAACGNPSSSPANGTNQTNGSPKQNPPSQQEAVPGVSADTIRIAAIGGLSGAGSYIGKAATAGFHDFISIVNEAGGIQGKKIEIVDIDHASDPGKAVAAVNQALNRENVFTIWVESSPAAVAIADLVERQKLPTLVISPATSIYNPPKKYLFTIGAPYAVEAARAVDYLVNDLIKGQKDAKIAWIGMDEASGQAMHEGAKAALDAYGYSFVTEQYIKRGSADVSSQVLNIKQSGANYVLMGTLTKEGAAILKEAEKLGLDATFVGTSFVTTDVEMFKLAGERYLNRFVGVWPIRFWDDQDPEIEQLKTAAQKNNHQEYVEIKSPYYLFGALAAYVITEAMKNADELTREGLVAGYEALHQYPMQGFVDSITFSQKQRIPMTKVRVIKVVKKGDGYTHEQISDFQEPKHIDKLGLPWVGR